MKFNVEQIADLLKGKIVGDLDREVWTLSKIEEGEEGSISFLSNPKYNNYIYTTKASVVIVNESLNLEKPVSATLIRVSDAYKAFTSLLSYYQEYKNETRIGIEHSTHIAKDVSYGDDFYLAAFSYIDSGTKIGKNVKIYPQVCIGKNVIIGDDVIIYSGAKIYNEVEIGNNCVINSGCVLGADGFGFAPNENMEYSKIPQLGTVILEDNVDLGACVTIDRATMGATTIKKGVKLDNQVHVAHNVTINKNTVIAAQTGIAGSTKIGEACIIGGQVGLAGHIKIADKTRIQAQSGVVKSTKEGATLQGTPAFDYNTYNKSYVYFRKLHSILKDIEERLKK